MVKKRRYLRGGPIIDRARDIVSEDDIGVSLRGLFYCLVAAQLIRAGLAARCIAPRLSAAEAASCTFVFLRRGRTLEASESPTNCHLCGVGRVLMGQ